MAEKKDDRLPQQEPQDQQDRSADIGKKEPTSNAQPSKPADIDESAASINERPSAVMDDDLPQELREQAERLSHVSEYYRNIEIPDSIDLYIERGIQEGKSRSRRRNYRRFSALTAAALLIVFVLGLRFSPPFAAAVSQIPGMEYLVNLVRYDEGLRLAVEHDFIQPLGISDEHDGVRLTINGVIADEHRMVILYDLKSQDESSLRITGVKVFDADTGISMRSVSHYPGENEGTIRVMLLEDEAVPKRVKVEMGVEVYPLLTDDEPPSRPLRDHELPGHWKKSYPKPDGIWSVEFAVDHEKFLGMQQTYEVNETITVQGQSFTIKRAIIHPIGVRVEFEVDPNNSMEIFSLEDLRLVNEHGDAYDSYARIGEEYYFESPYFNMPEKLYLEGDRIRALDKAALEIEFDLEKQQIVRAPDHQLQLEKMIEWDDRYELIFTINKPEDDHLALYHVFSYEYRDESGKKYTRRDGSYASGGSHEPFIRNHLEIPKFDYEGNLIFTITAYPNFIEGPFRVQIK